MLEIRRRHLVLELASVNSPETNQDLKEISSLLRKDAIQAFLTTEVLPVQIGRTLSPNRCGLPTNARGAKVQILENLRDLHLEIQGPGSPSTRIASFGVHVDATISFSYAEDATEQAADEISRRSLTKTLVLRGILTLDSHEHPVDAEVSRVEALADDPGLDAWRKLTERQRRNRRASRPFNSMVDTAGFLASLQPVRLPPEVFGTLPIIQEILARSFPNTVDLTRHLAPKWLDHIDWTSRMSPPFLQGLAATAGLNDLNLSDEPGDGDDVTSDTDSSTDDEEDDQAN